MATRRQLLGAACAVTGLAAVDALAARAPAEASSLAQIEAVRPAIVRRSSWHPAAASFDDAVEAPVRYRGVTIHHTAGSNSYTRSGAAATVRSIYIQHAEKRGWGDIGYNFLIDRFGTIFEGRAGSVLGTPLPTHTAGYNTVLLGIAMIGTFTDRLPTRAALASLRRLLTWACWRYGIDPTGTARYRVGEAAFIKADKLLRPKGTIHRGRTIAGHRAYNHTACPGTRLNAYLPTLRRQVDESLARVLARRGAYTAHLPAPVVPDPDPVPVQFGLTGVYGWSSVAGAHVYEILSRPTTAGAYLFDPRIWLRVKRVRGTEAEIAIAQGESVVLGVRALSASGEEGAVAELGQVSRPLFAKRIRATAQVDPSQWRYRASASYPGGGGLRSRKKGSFSLPVKGAVRLSVLAPTSPGAGELRIRLGSTILKTVSLDAEADDANAITVTRGGRPMFGTITIEATGSRPVTVVGVTFFLPPVRTDTTVDGHLTEYHPRTYPIRTTAR